MPEGTIVLASRSPRRKALLESAGAKFECAVAGIEEDYGAYRNVAADDVALDVARRKAVDVAAARRGDLIIGADTIVVLRDGTSERILGIPSDRTESRAMIEMLNGRRHHVITAVAILYGDKEFSEADEAVVQFRDLSREEMDDYVSTGEGDDKAGGYAVQGVGRNLVADIRGDIETVIGFPMRLVRKGLQQVSWEKPL